MGLEPRLIPIALFLACLGLNLAGLAIDVAWQPRAHGAPVGYFALRLSAMDGLPYWFLADLLLIGCNGAGIAFWWGEYKAGWSRSQTGGAVGSVPVPPVQIIGVNLVLIAILILGYIGLVLARV